jgi:hypothetical protein
MITKIHKKEMPIAKRFKKLPRGGIVIKGKIYYDCWDEDDGPYLYRIDSNREYKILLDTDNENRQAVITMHNRREILESL